MEFLSSLLLLVAFTVGLLFGVLLSLFNFGRREGIGYWTIDRTQPTKYWAGIPEQFSYEFVNEAANIRHNPDA